MSKIISALLLMFLFSASYSQDTIYLKNIDDTKATSKAKALYYKVYNRNVNPVEVITYDKKGLKIVKEHFSSLTPPVRDGSYETYFSNGKVDTKGKFKNGLMDSVWVLYNVSDNYIEQKINFAADLREDSAFTFNKYGKILKTDIYKHNELVNTFDVYSSASPVPIIDTTGVLYKAEVMPSFPGGAQALMLFMANHLRYPKIAREKGLEGKVVLKFIIKDDGAIANLVTLKDLVGGGCAEEAKRVLSIMPKWIPGTQDGKPVNVYYVYPVTFKLH